VEKAFIPPPWFRSPREGAERGKQSRDNRKANERKSKIKIPVNPSLLPSICALLFKLAERGYVAKLKVVRVRDLKPAKLLPPFLLKALGGRVARLELEISRD
jgi:hypothetical protein